MHVKVREKALQYNPLEVCLVLSWAVEAVAVQPPIAINSCMMMALAPFILHLKNKQAKGKLNRYEG
jgi:hypothetical protein